MVLLGWSIVATSAMTFFILMCHCGLYLSKDQKLKKSITKKKFIFDWAEMPALQSEEYFRHYSKTIEKLIGRDYERTD